MGERSEKQAIFSTGKEPSSGKWMLAGAVILVVAGLLGWNTFMSSGGSYPTVKATNGSIALPVDQISDNTAHFYSYASGPTKVGFFVIKSSDGVIRAALDTCDTCYEAKKGYRQEGDFMVCNNCDQKFRSTQINEVSGGCNPVALQRTVVGNRLVIAAAELDRGARFFQ